MRSRVVAGAVGAAFAMLVLAGCQAQPAPSSSTPTFATEEEAFAAAEETYRAYVAALNQVDLSDPETFEPVYEWTTGDANASSRESFSRMHADGWRVQGDTRFDAFTPVLYENENVILVTADLCLDVTEVQVQDQDGLSVVPETRADKQPVRVDFRGAPTETGLRIASSTAADSPLCTA